MQVCIYQEYKFHTFGNAFRAFSNMGRGPGFIGAASGMEMVKLMGTGSGNGFSIIPDLRKYVVFSIWKSIQEAEAYFAKPNKLDWYDAAANENLKVWLNPVKSHGTWNGKSPIRANETVTTNPKTAVLTRATIKTKFLPEFWMNVPAVSDFMMGAEGLQHRLGVGEYPLAMQATFSIWDNVDLLNKAAYENTAHADVVRKTRARGWYAEEMFTRFEVLKIERSGASYTGLPELIPERNQG